MLVTKTERTLSPIGDSQETKALKNHFVTIVTKNYRNHIEIGK